jgi:hypothetical protein
MTNATMAPVISVAPRKSTTASLAVRRQDHYSVLALHDAIQELYSRPRIGAWNEEQEDGSEETPNAEVDVKFPSPRRGRVGERA